MISKNMYVQGLFTEGVVKPETNEYGYQEYGDFYINSFDTNNDVITTWLINTDTNPSNYSYDAYGNKSGSSDNLPSPYGYNGYYMDCETGLYYLNARYYDPTTQQFTQEDTYWGDGTDLYAYCHFNPVMYSDPSGHISMSEIAELWAKQKAEDAIRAQYSIDNYEKDKSLSKKNYKSAVKYVNDYIKSYYKYDKRGIGYQDYESEVRDILRCPNADTLLITAPSTLNIWERFGIGKNENCTLVQQIIYTETLDSYQAAKIQAESNKQQKIYDAATNLPGFIFGLLLDGAVGIAYSIGSEVFGLGEDISDDIYVASGTYLKTVALYKSPTGNLYIMTKTYSVMYSYLNSGWGFRNYNPKMGMDYYGKLKPYFVG